MVRYFILQFGGSIIQRERFAYLSRSTVHIESSRCILIDVLKGLVRLLSVI